MDNRTEVRDFLTSRRARFSPEQAGLARYGARRVPGLRRAEVAQLAGVSIEYYTRLERGNLSGVSEAVLDALAGALQLDESERVYLFDLAKAASAPATPRRPPKPAVHELRPSISSGYWTRWSAYRRSCATAGSTSSASTPWAGPCTAWRSSSRVGW
jgi:transcriptional regulator with XRE-family HTH domain